MHRVSVQLCFTINVLIKKKNIYRPWYWPLVIKFYKNRYRPLKIPYRSTLSSKPFSSGIKWAITASFFNQLH